MRTYVLSGDALLRRIDLCMRRSSDDMRIVVPQVALEVFDIPRFEVLRTMALAAMEHNGINIVSVPLEPNLQAERKAMLSRAQLAVAQYAKAVATGEQAEPAEQEVIVVTASDDLKKYCRNESIATILPRDAAKSLPRSSDTLGLLRLFLQRSSVETFRTLARDLLFTIPVAITILLIAKFGDAIWDYLTREPLAAAALCLTIAVCAFWIRSKHRLMYGSIEIVIGVAIVVHVAFNHGIRSINQDEVLKAASGIYVIVRGLDNVGKALMGSRLGLLWWRIFGDG